MLKRNKLAAAACILAFVAAGCSAPETGFNPDRTISVLTREDGSGTRSAFGELFGLEEKDAQGNVVDTTMPSAAVTNSTAVMLTSTADNPQAIGYVSMGSLNDTVKAVPIEGADPTPQAVQDGSYPVSRPFILAVKEDSLSESARDFLDFVQSAQAQKIVCELGYVPLENAKEYAGSGASEKVVIHGSSSVTPLMEKLQEAYLKLYPNAQIELQASDSSTGIKDVSQSTADIAMASRELKDSELAENLTPMTLAMDGIAVIVNPENPVETLDRSQVQEIYQGKVTTWNTLE